MIKSIITHMVSFYIGMGYGVVMILNDYADWVPAVGLLAGFVVASIAIWLERRIG